MRLPILALPLLLPLAPAAAAPVTPRGQPIAITCTGAIATAGRKVAVDNNLAHGKQAKACFGRMQIYDGPNVEYVVTAPSPACPKGTAIDVYGRSRAGPWYSFFAKPVCGSTLSIGPKNQWGDWMLTIDGRRYDSRGEFYIAVP